MGAIGWLRTRFPHSPGPYVSSFKTLPRSFKLHAWPPFSPIDLIILQRHGWGCSAHRPRRRSSWFQTTSSLDSFEGRCCIKNSAVFSARRTLDRSRFPGRSDSTVVYTDGAGRRRFKGSPSLKGTQVYPPRFGRHVAGLDLTVCFNCSLQ